MNNRYSITAIESTNGLGEKRYRAALIDHQEPEIYCSFSYKNLYSFGEYEAPVTFHTDPRYTPDASYSLALVYVERHYTTRTAALEAAHKERTKRLAADWIDSHDPNVEYPTIRRRQIVPNTQRAEEMLEKMAKQPVKVIDLLCDDETCKTRPQFRVRTKNGDDVGVFCRTHADEQ